VSSEIKVESKEKEKKVNFLNKYLVGKESKDNSINDLHKNIIYKLKRPLNINLGKSKGINISKEKDSFELKFEGKNNRNIKRSSLFDSNLNMTNQEMSNKSGCVIPKAKLNESRSLLLNKDSSFLTSVSKNIDNIKSKLAKKLDYSTINNLSTNTTNNVSNVSACNINTGAGGAMIKRMASKKTSYNIKSLLEMNNNKICLSNLSNSNYKKRLLMIINNDILFLI